MCYIIHITNALRKSDLDYVNVDTNHIQTYIIYIKGNISVMFTFSPKIYVDLQVTWGDLFSPFL